MHFIGTYLMKTTQPCYVAHGGRSFRTKAKSIFFSFLIFELYFQTFGKHLLTRYVFLCHQFLLFLNAFTYDFKISSGPYCKFWRIRITRLENRFLLMCILDNFLIQYVLNWKIMITAHSDLHFLGYQAMYILCKYQKHEIFETCFNDKGNIKIHSSNYHFDLVFFCNFRKLLLVFLL